VRGDAIDDANIERYGNRVALADSPKTRVHGVLDTTYFFAASIARAEGSIQSGSPPSASTAATLPPSFS